MDSNNNKRRPVSAVNRRNVTRQNPAPVQVRRNDQRPAAPSTNVQHPNDLRQNNVHSSVPRQKAPRLRISPEERRAQIAAERAARQSRAEKLAVVGLLALILVAVIVIAKACRGDIVERDKYQIEENEPIVAADAAEDKPDSQVLVPTADETTLELDAEILSKYGVMVARSDGHIVASREADTRIYPASLTKVMSLIVAVENAEDLDETITFTNDMISPFYEQNASLAGFAEGETVALKDLLYGMILMSGADATEGVVRLTAENEENFVALMNVKANELGLKDTHFVNAVGLHDVDHYSTCNEMAIILDYALDNETCREILSTYKYTTAATEQNPQGLELTSNLQSRMEGGESGVARIHGGKTGYTDAAGNCLASYAKAYSDGEEYIIVTCLGAELYTPIFDHINACKIYLAGEDDTDESV